MKAYKISFTVKSSVITPFHSDTIWGHIAWACFYLWGEKFGRDFIQSHFDGEPTLVSNAFPDGYLPVPMIEPAIVKDGKLNVKKLKKRKFIKIDNFKIIKDNLNAESLYSVLQREIEEEQGKKGETFVLNQAVLRNVIDRITQTTSSGGGLFATVESFYEPEINFWFSISSNFLDKRKLERILKHIELTGYGADATMGRGLLKFVKIEENFDLPESSNANAFMTISNFIPKREDFELVENAWYRIFTKFPKLGGHFAYLNPFKKPLVFFEAGSVFKVRDLNKNFGQLVRNVHPNPEIVQYAFSFPLKVKLGV